MDKSNEIWKKFTMGKSVNTHYIRKSILSSWQRCKDKKVEPYDVNSDLLMKPDEKEKYVLKYLLEYQDEGFYEFNQIIVKLKLNISIYDNCAKLKYIINYDDTYDTLYPNVGYFKSVDEFHMGTNSISLALKENRPMMIVGSEHYKYDFHNFSCVAAPIYDKKNKLMGIINASFTHMSINEDTMQIIYSLARIYERLILMKKVNKVNNHNQQTASNITLKDFNDIIGNSDEINYAKMIAHKASTVDAPVLIYGETGTGKEIFANAIHNASARKSMPFIAINCGAIPSDLIESELFGYEAGAFTGAVKNGRKGLLEHASGGTLFLDEIEAMPMDVQVKLLRALSAQTITRIGGYTPIAINLRIISASKVEIKSLIKEERFREDLYYRINVIELHIPPIRNRIRDIEPIFNYYLDQFSKKSNVNRPNVSGLYYEYLEAYEWPGNVRELINFCQRALIFCENSVLDIDTIQHEVKESYLKRRLRIGLEEIKKNNTDNRKSILQMAEEIIINRVLEEENNNYTNAAKRLGISRPTLYKKIDDMR